MRVETMESKKDNGDPVLSVETVFYGYGNIGGDNLVLAQEIIKDEKGKEVCIACAKKIVNNTNSNSRYFIRHSPEGFYNPLNTDKRKHTFYKRHEMYNWIPVKQAGFDMYLQFLRTGKNQFLHQAERLF